MDIVTNYRNARAAYYTANEAGDPRTARRWAKKATQLLNDAEAFGIDIPVGDIETQVAPATSAPPSASASTAPSLRFPRDRGGFLCRVSGEGGVLVVDR